MRHVEIGSHNLIQVQHLLPRSRFLFFNTAGICHRRTYPTGFFEHTTLYCAMDSSFFPPLPRFRSPPTTITTTGCNKARQVDVNKKTFTQQLIFLFFFKIDKRTRKTDRMREEGPLTFFLLSLPLGLNKPDATVNLHRGLVF